MQEEVINNYLLWELSKPDIRSLIKDPRIPQNEIQQIMQKNRVYIESNVRTVHEKLKLVKSYSPHSRRAYYFANFSWNRKNYLTRYLGTVLPECGDLSPEVITRPLSNVIEYVKKRRDEPNQGTSVRYITNLMKIPDVLTMFPPIVVEPGSLQRKIMNLPAWARNLNLYSGLGYIEDGNHRAIAMAIVRNLKSIPCYVGKDE